jgi:hypothetical protein
VERVFTETGPAHIEAVSTSICQRLHASYK